MSNIHAEIFTLMERLFGGSLQQLPEATKSESPGYMTLHFDRLTSGPIQEVALHHGYKMNGDLVPDPDMRIRINHLEKTAEAISFQDIRSYAEVYREDGTRDPRQYASQNDFLHFWLLNCIGQGHELRPTDTTA